MRRVFAIGLGCVFACGAYSENLLTVYDQAVTNDPQLREANANRLAAREARPQALAILLPQVSGTASYQKDVREGPSIQATIFNGQIVTFDASGKQDATVKLWNIGLRQNVFSWSNWATLKRADRQVAQAEADYKSAEQSLMQRVAQAYFNVLTTVDNLSAQQAALESISRQFDQADKRYEVGLIAITDVEQAKAARDSGAAAVIDAKRQLATAQDALREITGTKYDVLARPAADIPLKSPEPADEERWVATSMDQNLALLSSHLAADIARENVSVAFGGHLPSLDLLANRSRTKSDAAFDPTGSSFSVPADSDIKDRQYTLQLTVPLFSGGFTQSQVRQSQYLWIAAKERLERTSRATERQARDAYLSVLSEISRVNALKQALESSSTALKATEAGYEVGTRTAVDVLDARRTLVQAQTNFSAARYNYILNIVALRLAAGNLERGTLQEINGWLDQTVPISPAAATLENTPPPGAPPPTTPPPPAR
ncbi:MAG TPA: TolC family outer membrane protein [Steroidobacteraceae bacterium]